MVVMEKATAVRADFSSFLDKVTRGGPAFVSRNRDEIAAMRVDQLELLLKPYRLTVEYSREKDGTFSGSFREIDLVGNAPSVEELKRVLAEELVDYALEFQANYELYCRAPNRLIHLPYVLRTLLQPDAAGVTEFIDA